MGDQTSLFELSCGVTRSVVKLRDIREGDMFINFVRNPFAEDKNERVEKITLHNVMGYTDVALHLESGGVFSRPWFATAEIILGKEF